MIADAHRGLIVSNCGVSTVCGRQTVTSPQLDAIFATSMIAGPLIAAGLIAGA
ncbi:hypothetical protein [Actinocorallia lasiicapitis]